MPKTGIDDYFAAGGTVAALKLMARQFDPADLKAERLSRDDKLRAALAELRAIERAMPTRKGSDCSNLATMRDFVREAERSGELLEDGERVIGVRVIRSARDGALTTQASLGGWKKSVDRLEAAGRLRRDNRGRPADKPSAYVLLTPWGGGSARREHIGGGRTPERKASQEREGFSPHFNAPYPPGVHGTRASSDEVAELRWSKVILYWERRDGRRVVADSHYVARLGKKRREIIAHLLEAGGSGTIEDLMETFASPRARKRDFRSRMLGPFEADKIITVEGESIALADNWRAALEYARAQADEPEDARRQAEKYARQRAAFRSRNRRPADKQPHDLKGKDVVAQLVEERRREDKQRWVEEQRTKVGMTPATFLAGEMDGVSAMRFADVRARLARVGGSVEDLRKAVLYGPWRFVREADGELYIYHEGVRDFAGPNERLWRGRSERVADAKAAAPKPQPKMPQKVNGVYQHAPLCDCEWCDEPLELSYAKIGGTA